MGFCDDPFDQSPKPPYYIHPDSLHIFEPKAGDAIQSVRKELTGTIESINEDGTCNITHRSGISDTTFARGKQIIQRNNKPFFWPESE